MIRIVATKALIGAAALAAVGGTTALAATPGATPNRPATASQQPAQKDTAVRQGVVVKLSDTQMTIERDVRDKTTKATTKDDTTVTLTAATRVFHAGSKDPVGREQLKLGERVRVRFATSAGNKVARRVVILRDLRAGRVIAKGNDFFVIHTARGGDVHVAITDRTRFITGKGRDGKDGSFAALKVGDRAVVTGEEDAQHNFDAARVRYNPPVKPAPAKAGATS